VIYLAKHSASRQALAAAVAALLAAGCGPASPRPAQPTPIAAEPTGPAPSPGDNPEKPVTAEPDVARPQELVFPEQDFRKEQPRPGAPRPFQLPAVQTFRLPSGIEVYLVEQHDLPIISLDLVFDGGVLDDPAGKEGLASVCMAMLSEGTEKLDKIAFNEALADIASTVDASAGHETQSVSMRSLSRHFDRTFALFVDTLRTPGFRQDELDRMIKRRLDALKQAKASPASVRDRVFWPVMFGKRHPFGHVTTEESLQAITIGDCKAHHAAWLEPKGARLFVVGDMTRAQIEQAFGAPLASWKGSPRKAKRPGKPQTMKGKIFFVDIPGAAQSSVSLSHFGPLRSAPDYFSTALMASIFGGGFASRVNMNLREDKGYSYGARGSFSYWRHQSVFTAATEVRSDATWQTIVELVGEIRALETGTAPATEAELDREKNGAILGLPSAFATGRQSLGMFRSLVYYGLPLDYYNHYVERVAKVTPAQVTEAARKHLRLEEAVLIVVGDGSAPLIKRVGKVDEPAGMTLREGLQQLANDLDVGKGGLVVLDADGIPQT
jgi:zinc protease